MESLTRAEKFEAVIEYATEAEVNRRRKQANYGAIDSARKKFRDFAA